MKTVLFILIILLHSTNVQSQTFFKTWSGGDFSDKVMDAEPMPDGNIALLCAYRILIVDGSGNVVREIPLEQDVMIGYHRMAIGGNGKFYLVAQNRRPQIPDITIYVYGTGGVLEHQTVIQEAFIAAFYDLHLSAGNLYLSYQCYPEEKPARLAVHRLAADGTAIWRNETRGGISGKYGVNTTASGDIEFAFLESGSQMLRIAGFDETGNSNERDLISLFHTSEFDMPSAFCKTPDGGYLFAGTEKTYHFYENAELMLIKLDADGKLEWKKLYDIGHHDELVSLQGSNDGYYLLATSGRFRDGWKNPKPGDIGLARIDLNGNMIWKKGLGSLEGEEVPTRLIIQENGILVGGYLLPRSGGFDQGFLLKTNLQGALQQEIFPHPLQEESKWKSIKLPVETKSQEVVGVCPLPDGGIVGVMQLMHPNDRSHTAYAFRLDAAGQQVWRTALHEFYSRVVSLKATPDGSFIANVEQKHDLFVSNGLVKFSADGEVLWSNNIWSSSMNDFIVLPDNSILVTGFVYDLRTGLDKVMIMKLRADGRQTLWERWYPTDRANSRGQCIAVTSDQRILVAGISLHSGSREKEIILLKTDMNGDEEWIKTFKGPGASSSPNLITATNDHHYLIGGYTEPLSGEDRDIMLVKTDRSGAPVWSRNYNFHKLDELKFLIPRGDTAWCLAGTTGEAALGNLSRFGFLANVRMDGTMNRQLFYGKENAQTTITSLWPGEGNAVGFTANLMMTYTSYDPFLGKFDPGVVTSAGELEIIKGITIAPVPARDLAWLTIDNSFMGNIRITVTGMNGMQQKKIESRKSGRQLKLRLPIQGFPAGVYQVEILMNNSRAIRRMMVLP